MLGAGIPVRHHHLGQRHAVRDGPYAPAVGVPDLVQDEALAVVEADPQGPVLPAERVPVQLERGPLGLPDLQRAQIVAGPVAGDEPRHVLAHHRRRVDGAGVPDVEQLHPVEVEHRMQAVHWVGVGVPAGSGAAPDVHPADPAVTVLLGDQRVPVGPGVEHDQAEVGDPAAGQCGDDSRLLAEHRVGLVPFTDRGVRLHARAVLEGGHLIAGERDRAGIGAAVIPVPAGDARLAGYRVTRPPRQQIGLRRLGQLDAGEPPPVADAPVAAQDRHGLADLGGRQRIERMTGGAVSGSVSDRCDAVIMPRAACSACGRIRWFSAPRPAPWPVRPRST